MDNTARRDSLIRLLRQQGPCSVADLAARLGVSRRTALRDLAALRTRGFAIAGESGRGGGVQLDPGSVLVSSQLDAEEVVALVLSVAVLRAAAWIPFAAGADRALGKIEGALAPARLRELRRFMSRVLVGDPVEVSHEPHRGVVDPALLPAFERAFTASHMLRFDYVDRDGRRTRRCVEPHGVLIRAPLWYIVAWDVDKDAARLFRMDRIQRAVVEANASFLPRPIELVTAVCPDARVAPKSSIRNGGFTSARVAVPRPQ